MKNFLSLITATPIRAALLPAALFLCAVLIAMPVAKAQDADDRPNIVVVLCDDLGYGDLECYGHPIIKTPNLNALADGGIRFTDFYSAAPVCSPSRVGLLTGRSPNRAGVYDWIPPSQKPRPDAREQVHLQKGAVTIPALLKQAGYATCMAGKWHCNGKFNHPKQAQPDDFGFDHWLGTQNNASPSHQQPVNFIRNGQPVGKVDEFSCQFVVTEALNWLQDTADDEQPFFLYLPFHEPHEPVASPQELVQQYLPMAKNEDQAQYFANVTNVDAAVGRLVKGLEKLGQRENTLIIFTSDNGPETLKRYQRAKRSYGTPGPLRGMKLHTTDAGFRVAGIMNWPAKVAAGQIVSQPVSSLDFLPTFCLLAGSQPPQDLSLDGTDFRPALHGNKIDRKKPLVWCYYNAINECRVAMRSGNYKVLAKLNGGKIPLMQNITQKTYPSVRDAELTDIEIYDVTIDIGESDNLAGQDETLTQTLSQKIRSEYKALVEDSHVWTVAQQ
ncbi:sulfatase-like hydrolase/transferase [Crateriforma spongiae]|uniref:sulfatase-like hydrolase/transferase n=1 Tax=Crateriforma spongiae TaxID=2724528 RepID=UPI0039AF82C2